MKHQAVPKGYRPVKDALPVALTRAREAVLSRWRPLLAARGFTEQQWRILRITNEFEPVDISTLARLSALHMPSVTRILQHLERNGYLERTRDTQDSRRSWITMTPKAKEVMYRDGHKSAEINARIEAEFGAEKLEQLRSLLSELADLQMEE